MGKSRSGLETRLAMADTLAPARLCNTQLCNTQLCNTQLCKTCGKDLLKCSFEYCARNRHFMACSFQSQRYTFADWLATSFPYLVAGERHLMTVNDTFELD